MARIATTTHKELLDAYGQRRANSRSLVAMTGAIWLKGDKLNMAIGRMHWWGDLGEMIDGLALLNQSDQSIKIPRLLIWREERGRFFKKEELWLKTDMPGGGGIARLPLQYFQNKVAYLASCDL